MSLHHTDDMKVERRAVLSSATLPLVIKHKHHMARLALALLLIKVMALQRIEERERLRLAFSPFAYSAQRHALDMLHVDPTAELHDYIAYGSELISTPQLQQCRLRNQTYNL